MQFTSLFVTLLLSVTVAARGNKTHAVTDKSTCKEMISLTKLVDLASNTTKLDAKTHNNATKIAQIQAKASAASVQLSAMTANMTLVSTCAVIDSAEKTENTCDEMKSLQKLVTLASNQTALNSKSKDNATKIAAVQAKASLASTRLTLLSSNTTLVNACNAIASTKAAFKAEKDSAKEASSSAASASSTHTSAADLGVKVGSVTSAIIVVAAGMLLL